MNALRRFQLLVSEPVVIQVVDEVHAGHADFCTLLVGHFPEVLVKLLGTNVKTAVHGDTASQPFPEDEGLDGLPGLRIVQITLDRLITNT